jgi:ribosomal protein S18 acetylase RimI-like enzyme
MPSEFRLEQYQPAHFDGVKALWEACFPGDAPWNRAEAAVPAKLAVQPELFFVAVAGYSVIGTTMAGYDGHRGWLYAVAVDPAWQRARIGTALVRYTESALAGMGCSKVNLQVRANNAGVAAFYERLGYATEERISMGKRL